jgi:hypothetical protein
VLPYAMDEKMNGKVGTLLNNMLNEKVVIMACTVSGLPSRGLLYVSIISFFTNNLIVWIRVNYR